MTQPCAPIAKILEPLLDTAALRSWARSVGASYELAWSTAPAWHVLIAVGLEVASRGHGEGGARLHRAVHQACGYDTETAPGELGARLPIRALESEVVATVRKLVRYSDLMK